MQLCVSKGERYRLNGKGVRTAPFPKWEPRCKCSNTVKKAGCGTLPDSGEVIFVCFCVAYVCNICDSLTFKVRTNQSMWS